MAPSLASAAAELCRLADADHETRQQLARTGELFEGYHPRMAAVHGDNARRLRAIVDAIGWPTEARVGPQASEAAWLVLQHAIGEPALMRSLLPVLWAHARRGEVPAHYAARLEDRVRALEGRPQRYGTQLDWGDEGELVPWPRVEQPETIDERRAEVGLPGLAQAVAALRRDAAAEDQSPPADLAARRRAARAWARAVGWTRDDDERDEPR